MSKKIKKLNWKKETPIEAKIGACLCCGGNHKVFPMDGIIAVGFGDASVLKNGVQVIDGERSASNGKYVTGQDAEDLASKEPDNDWRITKIGPLKEGEWQRQGEKHWVLIREGMGFA